MQSVQLRLNLIMCDHSFLMMTFFFIHLKLMLMLHRCNQNWLFTVYMLSLLILIILTLLQCVCVLFVFIIHQQWLILLLHSCHLWPHSLHLACLCLLLCKYSLHPLNIRQRACFCHCLTSQCFKILSNCVALT